MGNCISFDKEEKQQMHTRNTDLQPINNSATIVPPKQQKEDDGDGGVVRVKILISAKELGELLSQPLSRESIMASMLIRRMEGERYSSAHVNNIKISAGASKHICSPSLEAIPEAGLEDY